MKIPPIILPTARHLISLRALLPCIPFLLAGCVSSKYQEASKNTPPPQLLNVVLAPATLGATLNAVITYNGPGSWKRNAFWDEYIVTLHNSGTRPLLVSAAELTAPAGRFQPAGGDPWALEALSKTLEQKYKDAGTAFVRYVAPGAVLTGVGVSLGSAAYLSASAAGAAAVCFVALPAYYVGVLTINHYNRTAMEKEFHRRQLVLPLMLAPGETRTGSFFFPMVPSPRSLGLRWSVDSDSQESILPLACLSGLHLNTSDPLSTAK